MVCEKLEKGSYFPLEMGLRFGIHGQAENPLDNHLKYLYETILTSNNQKIFVLPKCVCV